MLAVALSFSSCSSDVETETAATTSDSSSAAATSSSSENAGSSSSDSGITISSLSHTAISNYGDAVLVIQGGPFDEGTQITVGAQRCDLLSASISQVTCEIAAGVVQPTSDSAVAGTAVDLTITLVTGETTTQSSALLAYDPFTDASEVAVGSSHACALHIDGRVSCWGTNSSGQLGDNSQTTRTTAAPVSEISFAKAVVSGRAHSCALLSGGSVKCWGDNTYGQLGNASDTASARPVTVTSLKTTAKAIAAGDDHNCVVYTDGTVGCWGKNDSGQIGMGSASASVSIATATSVTLGASHVSAGTTHSCARTGTGYVYCWGENGLGQVGNKTTTDTSSPSLVLLGDGTSFDNVAAISSGGNHTCAIQGDGELYCWGANASSQLGDGGTTGRAYAQANAQSLTAIEIAGGSLHTCAITSTGGVQCWGANESSQLGDGATASTSGATNVLSPDGENVLDEMISVSARATQACGVRADGAVICWGTNSGGNFGDGAMTNVALRSAYVLVGSAAPSSGARQVSTGLQHTCSVLSNGTAKCWGRNAFGQLGDNTVTNNATPVAAAASLGTIKKISSGGYHSCALLPSGSVYCWGYNAYGQLGNNTTTQSLSPVQVISDSGEALTDVINIRTGYYHTCATSADGAVYCWGKGTAGELGHSSDLTNSSVAINTTKIDESGNLGGIRKVVTSRYNSCALTPDGYGTVVCWGSNTYGQIGDNTTTTASVPSQVVSTSGSSTITSVLDLDVGQYHSCATRTDGTAACWGYNYYGQLGTTSVSTGTSSGKSLYPITISTSSLSGATAIAAGTNHNCASLGDGSLRCWGQNGDGQLGNGGTTTSATTTPQTVDSGGLGSQGTSSDALDSVLSLDAGGDFSCFITAEGKVGCFGDNYYGQLGNGDDDDASSPVQANL